MSEEREYPLIRTASVDCIFEDNAKAVAQLEGIDASEDDKEIMNDLKESVEQDLELIRDVQEEIFNYLTKNGCDVWNYIKTAKS